MADRTEKDGGSAFPITHKTTAPYGVDTKFSGAPGMSLRDYFAGQALVGCFNFWVQVNAKTVIGDPDPKAITELAYEYADAMLKARQS